MHDPDKHIAHTYITTTCVRTYCGISLFAHEWGDRTTGFRSKVTCLGCLVEYKRHRMDLRIGAFINEDEIETP